MQKVIVVEAPKKVKTLQKILGPGYIIIPTGGHIMDLPSDVLAVDIEDAFKVTYKLLPRKEYTVNQLHQNKAYPVFICTDADREGERIGAHVANILKIPLTQAVRATYRNLSHAEISKALETTRPFDLHLLDAQEARRVIDRLMGYLTSKWLWNASKLYQVKLVAAGRVQSAVLNLVVQREEDIIKFKPESYYLFKLKLMSELGLKEGFELVHSQYKEGNSGALEEIKYKSLMDLDYSMQAYRQLVSENPFEVVEHNKKPDTVATPPPLITSSLIKVASTLFSWPPEKIMAVAQELYASGYISYIRTDNPNVSQEFIDLAKEHYTARGSGLLSETVKAYKIPEGAQEAHEAIRPVQLNGDTSELDADQLALFQLISFRALLALAKPAIVERGQLILKRGTYLFKGSEVKVLNPGWYEFAKAFPEYAALFSRMVKPPKDAAMPDNLDQLAPLQYPITTKAPSRFTVATLTDEMEKLEIGRPATYVAVFLTLEKHQYIRYTKQRSIEPSESGKFAIQLLRQYFGRFIEADYTSNMEKDLDKVATGSASKETLLNNWYHDFVTAYDSAEAEIKKLLNSRPMCSVPLVK